MAAMDFIAHYERSIRLIVRLFPGQDKFTHLCIGMSIWLFLALMLRKPLFSFWPLATIVVLELGNEYIDYLANGRMLWADTLGDMLATWFWPFVLAFLLERFPALSRNR